jgi:hypothetical protein
MTPKQLEKKVRQLTFRRRLLDTVEALEEAIKAFMTVQGRNEIQSGTFIIRLREGILHISVKPAIDSNQIKMDFETQNKEENHEQTPIRKSL